jgi:hypothetical protein
VDALAALGKPMNGSKDQSAVTELLEAAKQARAMSDRLDSPDAKWGFQQLAAKWEAEAARLNKSLKH